MSFRTIRSLTVAFALAFSTHAFASGPVIEAIQGGEQVVSSLIEKLGFSVAAKRQASESLALGSKALGMKELSSADAIAKLAEGDAEVIAILKKPSEELTREDLAKLLNKMADSAGGSRAGDTFAQCSKCVEEELRVLGVANVLKRASQSVREVLSRAPQGNALTQQVKKLAESLNVSELKVVKQGNKIVKDPVKELAQKDSQQLTNVWTFLELTASGSDGQKKLGKAILAMSRKEDGKTALLEDRLWVLMTEEFSESDSLRLAEELEKASKNIPAGADAPAKRRQVFEQWIEKKSQEMGLSGEETSTMKSRLCRCYGIFPAACK
jgi:hypothetical protein